MDLNNEGNNRNINQINNHEKNLPQNNENVMRIHLESIHRNNDNNIDVDN